MQKYTFLFYSPFLPKRQIEKRSLEIVVRFRKLEDRLTQTNEQTEKKARLLRHNFEIEADNLTNQIAKEKMLRHSMIPRLPLNRDSYDLYNSALTAANYY